MLVNWDTAQEQIQRDGRVISILGGERSLVIREEPLQQEAAHYRARRDVDEGKARVSGLEIADDPELVDIMRKSTRLTQTMLPDGGQSPSSNLFQ